MFEKKFKIVLINHHLSMHDYNNALTLIDNIKLTQIKHAQLERQSLKGGTS